MLTEEGKTYAAVGSPEFQLFSVVPPEGIAREELQVAAYFLVLMFLLSYFHAPFQIAFTSNRTKL